MAESETIDIYESPLKDQCNPKVFLLEGIEKNGVVKSQDGQNWQFALVVPPSAGMVIFLWIFRLIYIFLFALGIYLYFLKIQKNRKNKSKLDLHMRGIAHDLRAPLGGLNVLAKDFKLLETEKGQEVFKKSLLRVEGIVETILDGEESSNFDKIGFFKVLKECKKIVENYESYGGVELNDSYILKIETSMKDSSVRVKGDSQLFHRILVNLINNSFESYDSHAAKKTVTLSLYDSPEGIEVVVSDQGGGFSKEQLIQFKQGTAFSSKSTGNGLGLQSSKEILESWGGLMKIDSEPGKITKIVITLLKS